MSEIGESIAELGQGVAVVRAVDPAAGEGGDGHTHESSCLNCGTALVGNHCHACGQAAHVHRTLGAFFHDLLHGVFHFEGKIWRTLPMLVWRPGRLTREYADGRRVRYVSPIALFLFSVFLMFAVFHATQSPEAAPRARTGGSIEAAIPEVEKQLKDLEAARKEAQASGQPTADFDEEIAARRGILVGLRSARTKGIDLDATTNPDWHGSDLPQIDKAIRKFRANPDLAAYKLQTYAYKYSWALIPISVPFLWLLFPFSRRWHLYDHTVFVTYSLAYMTLLLIAAMLLSAAGADNLAGLLFLTSPLHMYRQLRGAYLLSRGAALWRTALLVIFAAMALAVFFVLIMAQSSL